jgi:hypothetical protein
MHQPHQSDPVKSMSMLFLSWAACFLDASKSLDQPSPPAKAEPMIAANAAERKMDVLFISD